VCPPEIDVLIDAHRRGRSDLTVMLNPCHGHNAGTGQVSGIYVCNPGILEHIPQVGYFDIKEGLIPEMLRAKKTIHAAELPNHAGNFRDRQGYLYALANYLERGPNLPAGMKAGKGAASQDVWIAANAKVDSGARICGPAVIMGGASIASGAVVLGPSVLESDAAVAADSVVTGSVLWESAQVGTNCRIERSVIDRDAVVRLDNIIREKTVPFRSGGRLGPIASYVGLLPRLMLKSLISRMPNIGRDNPDALRHKLQTRFDTVVERLPDWAQADRKSVLMFLASCLVLVTFLWSYQSGLADLWELWRISDEYSSGLLVPFLAVYILWSRRSEIARCPIKPSLWGLGAFVAAQVVRLLGLFLMYSSAERLSIVMSVGALVLLLLGWQFFKKVSPILLFLCLMLPLPNLIQHYVGLHLQRYATASAVFCLEVIGYEVVREGNIIHIGNASVAVAEACNGLRMITAFLVISGLVILLVRRALWEKLVILASSLPIALMCNTIRLAVTAMFFTVLEGERWEKIFHDFGGYAMMPLALAAIVGELWLLAKLTTLPAEEEAIIITRQRG
ncbi:MAG: exosortase/archaeosortase family protein, partial [Planctomycetota bacterium]